MVLVSLVFWEKYISCQPNYSTFVYYHPLLKTKKTKTKIASIALKPITVLDTIS